MMSERILVVSANWLSVQVLTNVAWQDEGGVLRRLGGWRLESLA